MEKVIVTADALYRVLSALNGPDYFIRELQATRRIDKILGEKGEKQNPINILLDEYNSAVTAYNAAQQDPRARIVELESIINTASMELDQLYSGQLKGG